MLRNILYSLYALVVLVAGLLMIVFSGGEDQTSHSRNGVRSGYTGGFGGGGHK